MCGILTYYNEKGLTKKQISKCLDSLQSIKHRGPDGEGVVLLNTITGEKLDLGTYDTPRIPGRELTSLVNVEDHCFDLLLGHRRLSIFDTSVAGHQPMQGRNGNWIVFNGEIYNFFEIREELKILGHSFKTNTDTEVILNAYLEWGKDCLNKFNGMWSLILWDSNKKELFISNDRFGVKPLYYYKEGNELAFCSEEKQFISLGMLSESDLNIKTINNFLENNQLNYNNQTFFKSILRFKSGHFSMVDLKSNKGFSQESFYNFSDKIKPSNLKEDEQITSFQDIFKSAVEIRTRADVEWGVSVSGGLDSSAIAYYASEIVKRPFETFSAVFPGEKGDESNFIKKVVDDLGLRANYVNPLENFDIEDFKKSIYYQGYPSGTTSAYADWSVAKLIKQKGVKIVLSGQGADEVFGGYHHHFYKYCKELILSTKIRLYLKEVNQFANLKSISVNQLHRIVINELKLAVKFKLGLAKISNKLHADWNNASTLIKILKIDFFETTIPEYLRINDRNGMAFSVESRHPFMDYRLVEFGFNLPNNMRIRDGWQKWIIRKSVEPLILDEITWRKDKKGYTTPQKKWEELYKNEFNEYNELLKKIGVEPKEKFSHYTLGLWLSKYLK